MIKMDKITQQQLIDDHFLFKEGDRFLEAANSNRFWPVGRGIFYNDAKTFLVWCNEEDHLRLISMQKGGDLAAVYSRLVRGATEVGKKIPFSRHRRLGYLTFCPTNLGTTIRASVHARFPKLNTNPERFHEIANMYNLQMHQNQNIIQISSRIVSICSHLGKGNLTNRTLLDDTSGNKYATRKNVGRHRDQTRK